MSIMQSATVTVTNTSPITFKVEVRRQNPTIPCATSKSTFHRFSGSYTFAELRTVVAHLAAPTNADKQGESEETTKTLTLQYTDDEGDQVQLSSEAEWQECLRVLEKKKQYTTTVTTEPKTGSAGVNLLRLTAYTTTTQSSPAFSASPTSPSRCNNTPPSVASKSTNPSATAPSSTPTTGAEFLEELLETCASAFGEGCGQRPSGSTTSTSTKTSTKQKDQEKKESKSKPSPGGGGTASSSSASPHPTLASFFEAMQQQMPQGGCRRGQRGSAAGAHPFFGSFCKQQEQQQNSNSRRRHHGCHPAEHRQPDPLSAFLGSMFGGTAEAPQQQQAPQPQQQHPFSCGGRRCGDAGSSGASSFTPPTNPLAFLETMMGSAAAVAAAAEPKRQNSECRRDSRGDRRPSPVVEVDMPSTSTVDLLSLVYGCDARAELEKGDITTPILRRALTKTFNPFTGQVRIAVDSHTLYSDAVLKGNALIESAELGEAEHLLVLALEVFKTSGSSSTSCHGGAPAILLYNLACVLSLQGRLDESVDLLLLAKANGYNDGQHLQHDVDLENVREHPRFAELIDGQTRQDAPARASSSSSPDASAESAAATASSTPVVQEAVDDEPSMETISSASEFVLVHPQQQEEEVQKTKKEQATVIEEIVAPSTNTLPTAPTSADSTPVVSTPTTVATPPSLTTVATTAAAPPASRAVAALLEVFPGMAQEEATGLLRRANGDVARAVNGRFAGYW